MWRGHYRERFHMFLYYMHSGHNFRFNIYCIGQRKTRSLKHRQRDRKSKELAIIFTFNKKNHFLSTLHSGITRSPRISLGGGSTCWRPRPSRERSELWPYSLTRASTSEERWPCSCRSRARGRTPPLMSPSENTRFSTNSLWTTKAEAWVSCSELMLLHNN